MANRSWRVRKALAGLVQRSLGQVLGSRGGQNAATGWHRQAGQRIDRRPNARYVIANKMRHRVKYFCVQASSRCRFCPTADTPSTRTLRTRWLKSSLRSWSGTNWPSPVTALRGPWVLTLVTTANCIFKLQIFSRLLIEVCLMLNVGLLKSS